MLKGFSNRALFAVIGLCAAGLLAAAGYLQHGPLAEQPCPLCIMQRYLYIFITAVAFAGAIHGPASRGARVYGALIALIAAGGIGIATWQITKGSTMLTCIEDPIGVFINDLPMATWWPNYFLATAGCADANPPILGISVPVWSVIWFIAFFVAAVWALIARKR